METLPKLIEFATRAADDLCKGRLAITKSEGGWKAWFGVRAETCLELGLADAIAIAPTLEEALDQALRKLLKVTIGNLNMMLNVLECPDFDPDDDTRYPDLDDPCRDPDDDTA